MLGQKLLPAAARLIPVEIVASETFVDTTDRTVYTFNGTLDAASNQYVVGLLAAHRRDNTSNGYTDPAVSIASRPRLVADRGGGHYVKGGTIGIGIAGAFGPQINPVSQVTTPVTDLLDPASTGTAVHIILSGVKSVPTGSSGSSRSEGNQSGQTITFSMTPPKNSLILACAGHTENAAISWSGAAEIYDYQFGFSRFSVAYVPGDGSPVTFSTTTSGQENGFTAVAATFAP
jgi:hypothetical protein